MTRRRDAASGDARRESELSLAQGESAIEKLILCVLLSLIPLRAMLSEQHSFEQLRWLRYLNAPTGAMPGTTLLLIGLIAAVGVTLIAHRLWRGTPRYRWTGAEIGAALLFIAGVISYNRAGQKHLALVGTLDFLGLIVYFLLLAQVLTRPWHTRLVLCTIAATGAMVLAKAGYQVWVEIPDTIEYFRQHEAAKLAKSLGEDGQGKMFDFERRLESGDARGYFAHSNVFGSFLILIVMACFALARDRWRRTHWGWLIVPLLIAAISVIALAGSQSKGAAAALGLALLAFVAGEWMTYFRRKSRRGGEKLMATSVWVGFLAIAIGLVVTLHDAPAALGRSMLFRWMYWQGAARMVADQGLLGVGANNFGRYFPRYKSVECPEEVQDPHSWPVRLISEWGVLGLLGALAVFIGVTVMIAHRAQAGSVQPHPQPHAELSLGNNRSLVLWLAALGAIALGGFWLSMVDADSGFVAGALFLAGMPWTLGFLAVGLESTTPKLSDDAPVVIGSAVCAGLIGFLLHAGVDLALFWPGASTTFFAMLALLVSRMTIETKEAAVPARPRRALAMVAAFSGTIALATYSVKIVGPAIAVGAALEVARHNPGPPTWEGYAKSPNRRAYEAAIAAEPRDSTALDELLESLVSRMSLEQISEVQRRVPALRARDPFNEAADHYDATLHYQSFHLMRDPLTLERAIAAMWKVVNGYPTKPEWRVALAEMYQKLFETTASPAARDAAIDQYSQALDLDSRRIYVSELNRYTAERRRVLESRVKALRVTRQSAPAPQPISSTTATSQPR